MKKLLTLALLSTLTFAATDSATLNLRGIVSSVVDISITPESDALSLDLSSTASNKKVATVVETANVIGNYTVAVTSQNQGKLKHTQDSDISFSYSLSYAGQGVNLTSGTTFTRNATPTAPQSYDVNISYSGVPDASMVAGNYDDQVTFTISAN